MSDIVATPGCAASQAPPHVNAIYENVRSGHLGCLDFPGSHCVYIQQIHIVEVRGFILEVTISFT